jgi:hypothetical protein
MKRNETAKIVEVKDKRSSQWQACIDDKKDELKLVRFMEEVDDKTTQLWTGKSQLVTEVCR